jgi:hypothetical protein
MLWPAQQLIVQEFTVSAVNTKLSALNTVYSTSVPNLAAVHDGRVTDPLGAPSYPALFHFVGANARAEGDAAAFGVRDLRTIPVVLLYVTRQADLGNAGRDIGITLEALVPIAEGLAGKAFGATNRAIIKIDTLAAQLESLKGENATLRVAGALSFTLWMRTQGV